MLQSKDIEWLNEHKNKTKIYATYKRLTSDLNKHVDLKWEDGKMYSMQMEMKKKVGLAIFKTDKIDLKTKSLTGDKEEHYIMIKGSIYQEEITVLNIYATNIGTPKYTKQILQT